MLTSEVDFGSTVSDAVVTKSGSEVTSKHVATMRLVEITERPQTTLVSLTASAAEKIRTLQAEEPAGEAEVLRLAVQGGGCSGFQYALGFDRGPQEGDNEVASHGIRVVVDPFSAPYIAGTEIDWLDGLQAGFAINNPNVSAACGCGHSFQVEEGEDAADAGGAGCGSCH
jgi:iron-sulfur cluster assembly accessory protein